MMENVSRFINNSQSTCAPVVHKNMQNFKNNLIFSTTIILYASYDVSSSYHFIFLVNKKFHIGIKLLY